MELKRYKAMITKMTPLRGNMMPPGLFAGQEDSTAAGAPQEGASTYVSLKVRLGGSRGSLGGNREAIAGELAVGVS
jgi:hypothetical protein